MNHISVLKKEALAALKIKPDGIYVDATLGYGGHSQEILKLIPQGHLYAFDQDQKAIKAAAKELKLVGKNFTIIDCNFCHLKAELAKHDINGIDGILFDLGLSSPQIDTKERGFSYLNDGQLDMRMDQRQKLSAYQIVNQYSLAELVNLFYIYGEEKMAKVIAKTIINERAKQVIKTTLELTKIIEQAVGAKYFNKYHPERQIFQAIRIEVNQELNVLMDTLPVAIELLNPQGRIVVITFHSLEDRIVKNIFKKYSEVDPVVKGLPQIPEAYQPKLKIINKKPILPSEDEINLNSRSKSAKLRVGERTKYGKTQNN